MKARTEIAGIVNAIEAYDQAYSNSFRRPKRRKLRPTKMP